MSNGSSSLTVPLTAHTADVANHVEQRFEIVVERRPRHLIGEQLFCHERESPLE
jgi:hypothetical protein